jgi:hypothetical protein
VSDAITDTLLYTLAEIHAHADVPFGLDSAIRVLEAAQASLEATSADEKRHVVERAKTLAAKRSHRNEGTVFWRRTPSVPVVNERGIDGLCAVDRVG